MRYILICLLGALLMFGSTGYIDAQAKPDKLYTVNFENTSWKDVIDWLEKETGLICMTKDKPQASITLKSDKKHTIGELFDLLNELAEMDNLSLVRKSQSFSFYPLDLRYPGRIPHVTRADLQTRGKREFVSIFVQKTSLKPNIEQLDIKKLLSSYGEVSTFGHDLWVIQDQAGYIRHMLSMLEVAKEAPVAAQVLVAPDVCQTPVVSCQPVQRFRLFPLRKCR